MINFHLMFIVLRPIADLALRNKAVICGILLRTAAEMLADTRR